MPKVKFPLASGSARGQFGKFVIFQGDRAKQYAKPKHPGTILQEGHKGKFHDVGRMLSVLSPFLKEAMKSTVGPAWFPKVSGWIIKNWDTIENTAGPAWAALESEMTRVEAKNFSMPEGWSVGYDMGTQAEFAACSAAGVANTYVTTFNIMRMRYARLNEDGGTIIVKVDGTQAAEFQIGAGTVPEYFEIDMGGFTLQEHTVEILKAPGSTGTISVFWIEFGQGGAYNQAAWEAAAPVNGMALGDGYGFFFMVCAMQMGPEELGMGSGWVFLFGSGDPATISQVWTGNIP
jgi:hypothetical protein